MGKYNLIILNNLLRESEMTYFMERKSAANIFNSQTTNFGRYDLLLTRKHCLTWLNGWKFFKYQILQG